MRVTRAEIDLRALRFNYEGVRKRVGPGVRIMGIVKANAYGHGIIEVSRALVRFGIDYLGVGFAEEGIALRKAGVTCPVLVLGGVLGRQISDFLEHRLDITVSSLEIARQIDEEVRRSPAGARAHVHLKIDTGMERIGVKSENAARFIDEVGRLQGITMRGLYSHFATADEADKSFALEQLKKFDAVVAAARQAGHDIPYIHIANSGAVLDMPGSCHTMVRPGIMLYGIYPSGETGRSIPLRPVLSLRSNVVFIKEVAGGTPVSYGRKYTTGKTTRIATIPVGYGDGYPRRLSNSANVLIGGRGYPVVGTVCMDALMVDIGMDAVIHVGDDVTLIGADGGAQIGVWELSETVGTVPYEILTGIAARVPRIAHYSEGN
ncbi:MAG TPA: alanine racemase [Bacteroidota bacterium]|nr:alanine racemase [Bacteroidota bacterium]